MAGPQLVRLAAELAQAEGRLEESEEAKKRMALELKALHAEGGRGGAVGLVVGAFFQGEGQADLAFHHLRQ